MVRRLLRKNFLLTVLFRSYEEKCGRRGARMSLTSKSKKYEQKPYLSGRVMIDELEEGHKNRSQDTPE